MKRNASCFLSFVLLCAACTHSKTDGEPGVSYRAETGRISVSGASPFLKHLELIHTDSQENEDAVLKGVGQMIALANSPGDLGESGLSWVELDPDLSARLGLGLKSRQSARVGTAIGLTSVPSEYAGQIHAGQEVDISRYGLSKTEVRGVVAQVRNSNSESSFTEVIFQLAHGQDWYPGTSCEVRFPLFHVRTVNIPTTAILHEGTQEFVLREVGRNEFMSAVVSIVDETPDRAHVIGLNPGDTVIGSGAILLKPILHELLSAQRKVQHAL
jgi:hypothetical protein